MKRFLRAGTWPQHNRGQPARVQWHLPISRSYNNIWTVTEWVEGCFRGRDIGVGKESREVRMIDVAPAVLNKTVQRGLKEWESMKRRSVGDGRRGFLWEARILCQRKRPRGWGDGGIAHHEGQETHWGVGVGVQRKGLCLALTVLQRERGRSRGWWKPHRKTRGGKQQGLRGKEGMGMHLSGGTGKKRKKGGWKMERE